MQNVLKMSQMVIDSAKVHGHGKVHVPKDVREKLGLKDGDKLVFYLNESGEICISRGFTPRKSAGSYDREPWPS